MIIALFFSRSLQFLESVEGNIWYIEGCYWAGEVFHLSAHAAQAKSSTQCGRFIVHWNVVTGVEEHWVPTEIEWQHAGKQLPIGLLILSWWKAKVRLNCWNDSKVDGAGGVWKDPQGDKRHSVFHAYQGEYGRGNWCNWSDAYLAIADSQQREGALWGKISERCREGQAELSSRSYSVASLLISVCSTIRGMKYGRSNWGKEKRWMGMKECDEETEEER